MRFVHRYAEFVAIIMLTAVLPSTQSLYAQVPKTIMARSLTHDGDIDSLSRRPESAQWDNHLLVGFEKNHSNGPILYTIDENGTRNEMLFTFDDAARIDIYGIAMSAAGEVAVTGGALTGDSRGTTFIARIAADRKSQVVTRIWPYCALRITFAPDGTLWTIGHLKDNENTRVLARHVLRQFDPSGKMLKSVNVPALGWQTAELTSLHASRDRIGWFNLEGEYIEFGFDGSEIVRVPTPPGSSRNDITGVALSQDNDVVVSRFGAGRAEFDYLDRRQVVGGRSPCRRITGPRGRVLLDLTARC
ncbi:MAG TPA: hypothetical protein VKU01_23590 [Bryobacteraceae bacterium]|nr:hypothetical protein [Bryobacteraceae bacterium]